MSPESSQLTYGGPLLTVSSGTLGVKNPHGFVEAAVELRSIRREAQGVGSRQLVQVVIGPESGSHLSVKCIPHVDWVVTATAGEAAEGRGVKSQTKSNQRGGTQRIKKSDAGKHLK